IGKEVEQAMQEAMRKYDFAITEFTVAPQTKTDENELPFHEWLIEFDSKPENLEEVRDFIENSMRNQNSYYFDLTEGKVLQKLKIRCLQPNSFNRYMKSQGKLGGQNKIPRLANDRKIADQLIGLQP
ncbi:MAG: GH3 auxin-responsive promoter family protein, partial [Flavobacteriaceae bacterium]|nr:GH3 auxin-responsive promoter family protein [Flavobacteriaceae bacterium]